MLWVHVPMNWIDFLREIFKMILLFLSKDWNSVNTGSGEDVIILWPYMRSFHWNWGWKCIGKGRIMRWEKSSSLMMQLKPVSGFGASPILRPISLARQKKKNNRFYICFSRDFTSFALEVSLINKTKSLKLYCREKKWSFCSFILSKNRTRFYISTVKAVTFKLYPSCDFL